jgi:hypothetical protein
LGCLDYYKGFKTGSGFFKIIYREIIVALKDSHCLVASNCRNREMINTRPSRSSDFRIPEIMGEKSFNPHIRTPFR